MQINLPDIEGISDNDAKIILIGNLYERGAISIGKAAEMSGYKRSEFPEIMTKYGFKQHSYNSGDLSHDLGVLGL